MPALRNEDETNQQLYIVTGFNSVSMQAGRSAVSPAAQWHTHLKTPFLP